MTANTRPLALALALTAGLALASGAALAQDTATTAETPATGTAAGDAATADGLSLGQAVNPDGTVAPAVGQTYTKANFELWEQRCMKTAEGTDPCQLYQLLKDGTGNAVAEISIFPLAEGSPAAAGATVVAPLETLLTEQLHLAIDGGAHKAYPFTWCSQIGCVARIGFTAEEVAQFKKGAKAVVTIVPVVAPTEKVVLDVSLKGFTAGFDAVVASNVVPAAGGN